MTQVQTPPESDEWSRWLLHVRHGGDPSFGKKILGKLNAYADRVLDGAGLAADMTLADIGSGEGLVAFRAIDRIGPSLRVILTDISAPMLDHVKTLASERGVREQCTFVECPADRLAGIADSSVDVVTTRAVLAYVADKSSALREFFRILKPGGRISLAEPIFQDDALAACALRTVLESRQADPADYLKPLVHRWKAAQFPDTHEKLLASPLTNFSERTLFELARVAGFAPIHMELHIDLAPSEVTSWNVFLDSSPHPWAPALADILAQQFTPQERQLFEQPMRALVESGRSIATTRTAYINAVKATD
jgi:arsenite methyltransferase